MPPSENITDLDVLVPSPKRVRLGGVVYRLPGDMPLETFLRINALASAEGEGRSLESAVEDTIDAIIDLFTREALPEANVDRAKLRSDLTARGFDFVMSLMNHVYPAAADDEVEPPEGPAAVDADDPPTPEAGTTSTTT